MFTHRRLTRAGVVAGMLLASVSVGATIPLWSTPRVLGTSNLNFLYANNISVAVSAHPLAESLAVWTEPTTMTVRYAVQRTGVWTKAKSLYTSNANASETVTDPQVVIDASGTATAIWGSTKQGPMKYCYNGTWVYRCPEIISYAKSATLAPGATRWSKATLSEKGVSVLDPQLGVDAFGNVVAVWSYRQTKNSSIVLQSSFKAAGAGWSAPSAVATPAGMSMPRLAVGSGGHAMIAWAESAAVPPLYTLRVSYRDAGSGEWSVTPETAATPSHKIDELRAAMNGAGQAGIVWSSANAIEWARRVAGLWTLPETLASAAGTGPQLAADTPGSFLVTWLQIGNGVDGGNTIEAYLLHPDGSAFQSSWEAGTNVPASASLSPDGSLAVVAWLDEADFNVYAAHLAAPTEWSAPLLVSSGSAMYSAAWGMSVSLAAGPSQSATAVWLGVADMYGRINLLASSFRP